jgi:hypothetical protein
VISLGQISGHESGKSATSAHDWSIEASSVNPGRSVYQRFAASTEPRRVYPLKTEAEDGAKISGCANGVSNSARGLKRTCRPQQEQNYIGKDHESPVLGVQLKLEAGIRVKRIVREPQMKVHQLGDLLLSVSKP